MKPVLFTPREFLILNLLEADRYYNLADIRTLYEKFLALYGDTLTYLGGSETFGKVIHKLMQRGYLVKAKYSGCVLLLRLSHAALEQVAPGDKL